MTTPTASARIAPTPAERNNTESALRPVAFARGAVETKSMYSTAAPAMTPSVFANT